VTRRSDVNREWFIVIYKDKRKYIFNIHPRGDGRSLEQTIKGFQVKTVKEGPEVISEVLPELIKTFDNFGLSEISENDIHYAYRKMRQK
jgi:hypothetical protein